MLEHTCHPRTAISIKSSVHLSAPIVQVQLVITMESWKYLTRLIEQEMIGGFA